MTIITLTTDFGLKDGNVGVMKGVIWSIAPHVQIADLSHLISPQDVLEGALILARSAPYFPAGTIHVAVVDPGVGTERRPMAARLGEHLFVLPDNGLITLLLQRAEEEGKPVELVHLNRAEYWLPKVSHVFHGRDIFASVAAHLACGVALTEVGSPLSDPVRIKFPQPQRTAYGLRSEIIHIDHFGNLSTSVLRQHLGERRGLRIRLCGTEINGMVRTFGERLAGELVALYGSTDYLIISVVNGSAAALLGAQVGDSVEILYDSE